VSPKARLAGLICRIREYFKHQRHPKTGSQTTVSVSAD